MLHLIGGLKVSRLLRIKNTLPGIEKQGVWHDRLWDWVSNTRKRVIRKIEKFILVPGVSTHIWGLCCGM